MTAPAASKEATRADGRTLASLVDEERTIQAHSVAMEGGMPSCMDLFDKWMACYALGNQARSLYRHGSPSACEAKYDDFKWCLSVRGLASEQRDEQWVERRAGWWAARRMGKNSEDVWEARRNVYPPPPAEAARERETKQQAQPPDKTKLK